jgi:exonuclease SbcC
MIPRRIALEGFLSFRDEQTVDFDGASIWMLAGPNGVGKSAVFDAVTFALFGAHRGGQQNAEELIHKGSTGLRVAFDFQIGEALYRIERSVKRRGRSTRQIYRHEPGADGDGWRPEPATERDDGFNAWIREHVGLSYRTFTSSVLLLQGGAERLIAAPPTERLVVLKDIVGIDRYERLHRRVDERRKALGLEVGRLGRLLDAAPRVEEDDVERARRAVAAAEEDRDGAQQEIDRLVGLERQARAAADLRAELDGLRRWCERAQRTLDEAEAIEGDLARWNELRGVLPPLEVAIEQRDLLAEADRAIETLGAQQEALEQEQRRREGEQARVRARLENLGRTLTAAEQEQRRLARRLVALAGPLERAGLCEQQARRIAELEGALATFPADLDSRLASAQDGHDRLDAWGRALPTLARLAEARAELRWTRDAARALEATHTGIAEEIERLGAEHVALTEDLARAARSRQEADALAIEARAERDRAITQRRQLDELSGSSHCLHCGQALTPEHLAQERAARAAAVAAAEGQWRHDQARAEACRRDEETATIRARDAQALLDAAIGRETVLRRDLQSHARDADRHARDCTRAHGELPEPFRARVGPGPPADWAATTFPTPDDLEDTRRKVAGLDRARRQLSRVQKAHQEWTSLHDRWMAARQTWDELAGGLPEDAASLRREHAELEAAEKARAGRLEGLRRDGRHAEADRDRLGREHADGLRAIAETMRLLAGSLARRQGHAEALARAREILPESWRVPADSITPEALHALQDERNRLEERGGDALAQNLRDARARLEWQRGRIADLRRQLDAVPAEALRDPAELRGLLGAARDRWQRLDGRLTEARQAMTERAGQRRRRLQLEQEARAAEKDHATGSRLAELLGPRGLQRQLVREAEAGILQFANGLLDHLSGGQHVLQLRGDDAGGDGGAEKALDLEVYNRATRQAIGVAFLSGSQRFRVAVSLALGIGRYASRLHRPIESVIIDEGFGCLDREGRQVMIQELQGLRAHVRRIVLVSHQEEFADAFADGYRLELRDGTTVAIPFSS